VAVRKKVTFVDDKSDGDDISRRQRDNGLHPTVEGYSKIADFGTTPC